MGPDAGAPGAQSSPLGEPQVHRPVALSLAQAQPQGARGPSKGSLSGAPGEISGTAGVPLRWAGEDAGHPSGHSLAGSPRVGQARLCWSS